MRPSGVTAKDRSLLNSLSATFAPMIRVNELAAAMIDVAVNGDGVRRGRIGIWFPGQGGISGKK